MVKNHQEPSTNENYYNTEQRRKYGKRGLVNLGNTCYMNSAVQALYTCQGFRKRLLQCKTRKSQLIMTELKRTFRRLLSVNEYGAVDPRTLYQVARPEWFPRYSQQDSSEFLRYILQKLDEENESSIEVSSLSLADVCFGGQLQHCYRCLKCEDITSTEEKFYDIPLNLVPNYKELSLTNLMDLFLKPDLMDGLSHCEKCGTKEKCERKTQILKYPEYLVLNLMRFQTFKNLCKVHYPCFIEMPMSATGPRVDSLKYGLISVIVHSGFTASSGHYFAYGRDNDPNDYTNTEFLTDKDCFKDKWYMFNDACVLPKKYEDFAESNKYSFRTETSQVLVYQRIAPTTSEEHDNCVVNLEDEVTPSVGTKIPATELDDDRTYNVTSESNIQDGTKSGSQINIATLPEKSHKVKYSIHGSQKHNVTSQEESKNVEASQSESPTENVNSSEGSNILEDYKPGSSTHNVTSPEKSSISDYSHSGYQTYTVTLHGKSNILEDFKSGYENVGKTSCMNAALQMLFMCSKLRNGILKSQVMGYCELFTKMQTAFDSMINTKEKNMIPFDMEAVSIPSVYIEHDKGCSDFPRYLLRKLDEEENTKRAKSLVQRLFGLECLQEYRCKNCDSTVINKKNFHDMDLNISVDSLNCDTVHLEEFLQTGSVSDLCTKCKSTASREVKMRIFPEYLIVSLSSIQTTTEEKKRNSRYRCVMQLTSGKRITRSSTTEYSLISVINHTGNTKQSCTCYAREENFVHTLKEGNDKWYRFDMNQVYETKFDHIPGPSELTSCVLMYRKVSAYRGEKRKKSFEQENNEGNIQIKKRKLESKPVNKSNGIETQRQKRKMENISAKKNVCENEDTKQSNALTVPYFNNVGEETLKILSKFVCSKTEILAKKLQGPERLCNNTEKACLEMLTFWASSPEQNDSHVEELKNAIQESGITIEKTIDPDLHQDYVNNDIFSNIQPDTEDQKTKKPSSIVICSDDSVTVQMSELSLNGNNVCDPQKYLVHSNLEKSEFTIGKAATSARRAKTTYKTIKPIKKSNNSAMPYNKRRKKTIQRVSIT